jgi:hypothetical protein
MTDKPVFRWAVCGVAGLGILVMLTNGRSSGDRCEGNLRRVVGAVMEYAGDHDDRLPIAGSWMDDVMPYVGARRWFHCPERSDDTEIGYAFLSLLSAKPLHTLRPAVPMIYDSDIFMWNASDDGASLPISCPENISRLRHAASPDGTVGFVSWSGEVVR